MTDSKNINIVLPCYNPTKGWATNIVKSLKDIQVLLPDVIFHLILVNDSASKGIFDTDIRYLEQQIPHFQYIQYSPNRGKGYALRQGISQVEQDICIYTDVDFPYEAKSFAAIYQLLASQEADIAVGIKSENYYKNVPPMRIKISKLLRFFIRFFLKMTITDTQCGLKGFNQKGKAIFMKTTIDRYLFDLEFVYLSDRKKSGVKMLPVVAQLKEGVRFSSMNSKVLITEGVNFLKILGKSIIRRS